MAPARYLITAETLGKETHERFDDTPSVKVLPDAVVTKIRVAYNSSSYITGIEVHYATDDPKPIRRGGASHSTTDYILQPSEYITAIEGSLYSDRIRHLTFITNKRILGTVGSLSGERFFVSVTGKVPSNLAHRMGLIGFAGSMVSSKLSSLEAIFAEYPCEELNTKYEIIPLPFQSSGAATAQNPMSTFARQLMNPDVKIYAGPNRTEYHASEESLCKLEFFRACLQGKFKEATEKAINMPDDDAAAVAALIEFLYTGRYTYAYTQEGTELRAGSAGEILHIPVTDILQAEFHLAVYSVASKYDFQALGAAAAQNLRVITREADVVRVLQVCEAMYRDGLQISDLGKGETSADFKGRLTEWVKSLCNEHRVELVTATGKYPDLACDLMDLATKESEK